MAAEAGVLAILPRVQDLSGSAIVLIKSEVAHIAAKLKYWSHLSVWQTCPWWVVLIRVCVRTASPTCSCSCWPGSTGRTQSYDRTAHDWLEYFTGGGCLGTMTLRKADARCRQRRSGRFLACTGVPSHVVLAELSRKVRLPKASAAGSTWPWPPGPWEPCEPGSTPLCHAGGPLCSLCQVQTWPEQRSSWQSGSWQSGSWQGHKDNWQNSSSSWSGQGGWSGNSSGWKSTSTEDSWNKDKGGWDSNSGWSKEDWQKWQKPEQGGGAAQCVLRK